MGSGRYFICKREGRWRIFDRTCVWVDVFDSLDEAHTWATQSAFCDDISEPGCLDRLKRMLQLEEAEFKRKLLAYDSAR